MQPVMLSQRFLPSQFRIDIVSAGILLMFLWGGIGAWLGICRLLPGPRSHCSWRCVLRMDQFLPA
jgi:hypothetical protein